MDLVIALPLLVIMLYALAYGYVYPLCCGARLARLALADTLASVVVLLVCWLYAQRINQHHISVAGSHWHWLWYAIPLMVIADSVAFVWYARRYAVKIDPPGDS